MKCNELDLHWLTLSTEKNSRGQNNMIMPQDVIITMAKVVWEEDAPGLPAKSPRGLHKDDRLFAQNTSSQTCVFSFPME